MYTTARRTIKTILACILCTLISAFAFFCVIFALCHVVYIKTTVYKFSMCPTLNANVSDPNAAGDTVYVNRFAKVSVNDIVVAEGVEGSPKDSIIKRLVGMPSDEIKIVKQQDLYLLFCNDKLLYTRDVNSATSHHYNSFENLVAASPNVIVDQHGHKCIKLMKDEYFLLSDNWIDTSIDSLTFGAVKEKNIVGKVDIIVHKGENKFWTFVEQLVNIVF